MAEPTVLLRRTFTVEVDVPLSYYPEGAGEEEIAAIEMESDPIEFLVSDTFVVSDVIEVEFLEIIE